MPVGQIIVAIYMIHTDNKSVLFKVILMYLNLKVGILVQVLCSKVKNYF